jgi:hypothetical protein
MIEDLPPRSSGVRGSITSNRDVRKYGTVFQRRIKGKKVRSIGVAAAGAGRGHEKNTLL